jgi:hypothetical protein
VKWSVSNIEIDLTPPPPLCVRNWAGWSSPSIGEPNQNGDSQYDLIDDGTSSTLNESIRSFNASSAELFVDDLCPGDLAIVEVTDLQAAMTAVHDAVVEERLAIGGDPVRSGQVTANIGNAVAIDVFVEAGYDFDGITHRPYTSARVRIIFNGFPDVETVTLINDSQFDTVLTVPDPGLVWRLRDEFGTPTYSHAPDGIGAYPGFGADFTFHAAGVRSVTGGGGAGTDYPLTTSQFFSNAGLFLGEWTVAEALALI